MSEYRFIPITELKGYDKETKSIETMPKDNGFNWWGLPAPKKKRNIMKAAKKLDDICICVFGVDDGQFVLGSSNDIYLFNAKPCKAAEGEYKIKNTKQYFKFCSGEIY